MPGPTRPRRTSSDRRPVAAASGVVRGLFALVVLLAMVVGIPALLLAVDSTSYLGELADLPRLASHLTGPDDGALFLAVLAGTAWLGWATFALAVVLEIPAQLRRVPSVRLPGLGVQQSLAGTLVAAVLAVVLLPGAAHASERSR